MKKIYSMALLLVAFLTFPFFAKAQDVMVNVSVSNGECLKNGTTAGTTAGHYFKLWKAKGEVAVTITTANNDMWIAADAASIHFYNRSFTITAPAGYTLKSYRFDFQGFEGNSNTYTKRLTMSVTPSGATEVKCAATEASATVSAEVGGKNTASFTVSGNGNIVPGNFVVTLTKNNPDEKSLQPFVPTTVTNGQFAENTMWYVMHVRSTSLQAKYEGDSDISLVAQRKPLTDDAYLWCFVGDKTTGYKVYNKAAGATKVLNAGTKTNQTSPVFEADNAQASRWYFTSSASAILADSTSVYMTASDDQNATLNDFGGNKKLLYWTGGKDVGSTMVFCDAATIDSAASVIDKAQTTIVFDNQMSKVPYRIPALAKTADGKLILVVDYRYSKADIGNGPLDLRYKISLDNGKTGAKNKRTLAMAMRH